MQFSFKRAKRAPLFATLALAALLLVPVSANAAMGGANPASMTLRGDLRSITVTAVDASAGTTDVQYCFDKQIGSTPHASGFHIGTYRNPWVDSTAPFNTQTAPRTANSAARTGPGGTCATAVFSSLPTDVQEFTYGTVDDSATVNFANGHTNWADSSALILPAGIGTHTGTENHHSAPTLIGIVVTPGAGTVNYQFDKRVAYAANSSTKWWIEDQLGDQTPCTCIASSDVVVSGNVVSVKFPIGPALGSTVRAGLQPGTVGALADIHTEPAAGPFNPTVQASARSGFNGLTDLPDLQSATVAPDGSYIDYVFDEDVAGPTPEDETAFHYVTSDGREENSEPGELAVRNGNTVRWTPTDGTIATGFNEFLVQAAVDRGAVRASLDPNNVQYGVMASTRTSSEGHTPLGNNAGAFASGYTAGAEGLRTTFDFPNKQVKILLDQRVAFAQRDAFTLFDDTGEQLGFVPISVSGTGGPASQVTLTLTYNTDISGARSVSMDGDENYDQATATNSVHGRRYGNVDQILAPTGTAHYARKNGRVVWHRTKVQTKRHAKRLHARSKRNK